jgi:hypothetical protein
MELATTIQLKEKNITNQIESPNVKVSVGLSRKWDAREAGQEVATEAISKLGTTPNFFLLFATIHYEKYGGFESFLSGVYDVLPKNTTLIGGTIAGFIIPQGCFTRGATALAVSYPNMDVALGYGKNTKRSPKLAAKNCAYMIKKSLNNSRYNNKFLFSVISGTKVMEIPGMGRKNVITFKPLAGMIKIGLSLSTVLFQKGAGREEEVLEILSKELPDFSISHAATMDDMALLRNYQFYNDKVMTDAITVLGISTDLDIRMDFSHGCTPVKDIKITHHSGTNRLTDSINNKPAVSEFTKIMDLPPKFFFHSDTWAQRFPYFPLGYKKGNKILPRAIVMVLNQSLFTKTKIDNDDAFIMLMSGQKMYTAFKNMLFSGTFQSIKPKFGLIVSCAMRLTAIGNKIYQTRDTLLEYFKDTPFLLIYTAGEGIYTPETGLCVLEESMNLNVFGKKIGEKQNGMAR